MGLFAWPLSRRTLPALTVPVNRRPIWDQFWTFSLDLADGLGVNWYRYERRFASNPSLYTRSACDRTTRPRAEEATTSDAFSNTGSTHYRASGTTRTRSDRHSTQSTSRSPHDCKRRPCGGLFFFAPREARDGGSTGERRMTLSGRSIFRCASRGVLPLTRSAVEGPRVAVRAGACTPQLEERPGVTTITVCNGRRAERQRCAPFSQSPGMAMPGRSSGRSHASFSPPAVADLASAAAFSQRSVPPPRRGGRFCEPRNLKRG